MPDTEAGSAGPWLDNWLDAVQDGQAKMSQRKKSSIEKHGGIEAAIEAATIRGIHLVQLTDEKGHQIVAASLHPFRALC